MLVVAATEYKLKYPDSWLGYVWSVIKPLALFTLLYLVFGRIFKLDDISEYYPLGLLIGIVLFAFFADATSLGMTSIVANASLDPPARLSPRDRARVRDGHRGDHVRCQLRRRRRVHRLKGITPQLDWLLIAAAPRALHLRPRRCVHPLDAVRLPPRHRPGLGARAAAPLLRLADHLPDRLPAAVGPRPRIPQPVHAGHAGHPRPRCSTRTWPATTSSRRGRAVGRPLVPIAITWARSPSALLLLRRHEARFAERV